MSNDHELLELAAKAAGINTKGFPESTEDWKWQPLRSSGFAFTLMVQLGLEVRIDYEGMNFTIAYSDNDNFKEHHGSDPYAATRRAIVRAAAEIGREMP